MIREIIISELTVNLAKCLQARVSQGVSGPRNIVSNTVLTPFNRNLRRSRVWVRSDTSGVVNNVLSEDIIHDSSILVLGPSVTKFNISTSFPRL